MTAVEDTVAAIKGLDLQALQSEVNELRAIREWALAQLDVDFTTGDRVVITSLRPSQVGGGWEVYREALAVGQTGIAGKIYFNQNSKRWQVLVGMDRAWSVHESGRFDDPKMTRYWRGPASETPEGFEPPSEYDQQRHPEGRVKHFALDVTWLAMANHHSPTSVAPAAEGAGR